MSTSPNAITIVDSPIGPMAGSTCTVSPTWLKIINEINHVVGQVLDQEEVPKAEFDQSDREWFYNICIVA